MDGEAPHEVTVIETDEAWREWRARETAAWNRLQQAHSASAPQHEQDAAWKAWRIITHE